jgi:hypothetical protein
MAATGCVLPKTQDLYALNAGVRVRVWHHSSACCVSPVIGTLVNYDVDSLRLRVPAQPQLLVFARASIDSLQSARRATRTGRGALIGLGIGAVSGGIFGFSTTCSHCDGDWRGFGMLVGGGAGAILGVFSGAMIGTFFRRDVWDPVSP